MQSPKLTYTCWCGDTHVLRIIALENPPIPYHAWPDDSWYIHDSIEPGHEEVDQCLTCDRDLPRLLYNLNRDHLTADARIAINNARNR